MHVTKKWVCTFMLSAFGRFCDYISLLLGTDMYQNSCSTCSKAKKCFVSLAIMAKTKNRSQQYVKKGTAFK